MTYYADAGDKLIEAKPQVNLGYWGAWLSKNFERSQDTARLYMRLARARAEQQNMTGGHVLPASLSEMRGKTTTERKRRASERPFRTVLQELDTDYYTKEKQTRDDWRP